MERSMISQRVTNKQVVSSDVDRVSGFPGTSTALWVTVHSLKVGLWQSCFYHLTPASCLLSTLWRWRGETWSVKSTAELHSLYSQPHKEASRLRSGVFVPAVRTTLSSSCRYVKVIMKLFDFLWETQETIEGSQQWRKCESEEQERRRVLRGNLMHYYKIVRKQSRSRRLVIKLIQQLIKCVVFTVMRLSVSCWAAVSAGSLQIHM